MGPTRPSHGSLASGVEAKVIGMLTLRREPLFLIGNGL